MPVLGGGGAATPTDREHGWTFIEIISTPTSYSVEDDTDDKAVWDCQVWSLDTADGLRDHRHRGGRHALTLSATLYFMTATTNVSDKSLWARSTAGDREPGPSSGGRRVHLSQDHRRDGEPAAPALPALALDGEGYEGGTAQVLVTVRGIGRAG
ncbi:MAG: hypothetical protein R3A52_21265 [Polyangiales bacterium]